jgi:type II secretory pathway component PulF
MLIAELAGGRGIDQPDLRPRILPKPVLAVLQLAADRSDLPSALATLSAMYEQQAEMRLAAVQSILAPALLLAVAILIGATVVGLFAPLVALLRMF